MHAEQRPVVRVDWYHSVGLFNIELGEKSPRPNSNHQIGRCVHRWIAQGAQICINAIIDAETLGSGEIDDKAPLARLGLFGYHTKAAHMKTR